MAKHTPGPWTYDYNNSDNWGGQWYELNSVAGDALLWFPYNGPHSNGEVEKANARLMAASPKLLEACIALQAEAKARNCGLRIADEAIAEALGESA